ncbi:diphthine--ammonia ligase [Candidatus Woesearchaeota archaeon]|nr:diphthine--ammonia ligase [Candidatus Woesearchaeota archaeon]
MKLGALVSSGKDSLYALYLIKNSGYEISCIITLKSRNPDSYMFHSANIDMVDLQAESMRLPLVVKETEGEKEKELLDLKSAIIDAIELHQIEGIITGALYSVYQKSRIEKICRELKLAVFSPLWHMDQADEMKGLLNAGFKVIFTKVAAEGLDKSWLNLPITYKHVEKLEQISREIGINIAGEGGEYESLVLDCPLFSQAVDIINSRIVEENDYSAELIIGKAVLTQKPLKNR